MARKQTKIDWSLTGCCGKKTKKVAGLIICSGCGRQVEPNRQIPESLTAYDRHDNEFNKENVQPSLVGRLDRELK